MKLSELSTDQALDALCELTPYVSNIVSDETMVGAVGKVIEGAETLNVFGKALILTDRIGEIIPVLLKTHRPDIYGILSVVNQKEQREIAAQTAAETIRQVRELFGDRDLLAFFTSSARQAQTEPSAPSAASPGSE